MLSDDEHTDLEVHEFVKTWLDTCAVCGQGIEDADFALHGWDESTDDTELDIKPDPLAFIVTYSLILAAVVVVWVVGVDGLVQLWRAL